MRLKTVTRDDELKAVLNLQRCLQFYFFQQGNFPSYMTYSYTTVIIHTHTHTHAHYIYKGKGKAIPLQA